MIRVKKEVNKNSVDFAPLVITPVSEILENMKRSDPKKLTEMLGIESGSSTTSTDDNFVSKPNKKGEPPNVPKVPSCLWYPQKGDRSAPLPYQHLYLSHLPV